MTKIILNDANIEKHVLSLKRKTSLRSLLHLVVQLSHLNPLEGQDEITVNS